MIDAMLSPATCELLEELGHRAVTPQDLGAHNLPDEALVEAAAADGSVIVTENARDFAHVRDCPVLLVRKAWWVPEALGRRLATALDRWATDHPDPGPWAHWLRDKYR